MLNLQHVDYLDSLLEELLYSKESAFYSSNYLVATDLEVDSTLFAELRRKCSLSSSYLSKNKKTIP